MNQKLNIENKKIAVKIRRLVRNRKIFVFIIFFFIATLLWFLNTLNKEYNSEIEIPIRYANIPNEEDLSDDYTKTLKVSFSGHGYNILKVKMESFTIPLIINLNRHKLHPHPFIAHKYFIPKREIQADVGRRLGAEIVVNSISPDTLYFNYRPVANKTVPIKLNAEYRFKDNYMLTEDVVLSPDSIKIFGNKSDLDSINYISTNNIYLGDIKGEQNFTLSLRNYENIRKSRKDVDVYFKTKKHTEARLRTKIKHVNFPENSKITLVPNKVDIIFLTPVDKYNNIKKEDFEIIADYNKRSNNVILLEVKHSKDYHKRIRLQPKTAYFLLEKK